MMRMESDSTKIQHSRRRMTAQIIGNAISNNQRLHCLQENVLTILPGCFF